MTPNEALQQLKRGNSLVCVTPNGTEFEIRSKLAYGTTWYRAYPTYRGCLNHYSRLSDDDMLQWLGSLTLTGLTERTVAQVRARG